MRFIGTKEKLIPSILEAVAPTGLDKGRVCDLFSGTGVVARNFKALGNETVTCDVLYFCYCMHRASVQNSLEPSFEGLSDVVTFSPSSIPLDNVIAHLDALEPVEGFIYRNYTPEGTAGSDQERMFFTGHNGGRIDSIRQTIEAWLQDELITEDEYFVLLASLIETVPYYANIAGVYAAFLKAYDPRALKPLRLRRPELCTGRPRGKAHLGDGTELVDAWGRFDLIYLDPPYNARQYGANYHLLETIARYDDPPIRGVAGLRDYSDQKSAFCNRETALRALREIASGADYGHLLLSYNSEGIMPTDAIVETLSDFGTVEMKCIKHRKYKSNSRGPEGGARTVDEQLFLLRRS